MKKWVYVSLHLLGWLLFLAGNIADLYRGDNDYMLTSIADSGLSRFWFGLVFHAAHLFVLAVAFYGAYFLIGPSLFTRKKYLRSFVLLLLVLTVVVLTRWLVEFRLLLPYLHFDNYMGHPVEPGYYIKNCILYSYKYSLIGLVVYFIMASNRMEKEKKEIEKEKIQAELSFLKSQVNPHFLFNTINDIYALTYQKDDKAPEALLKLSSMLRYMLEEGTGGKVQLRKELSYLEDYIELQRIGLKGNLFLQYTVQGITDNLLIPPLLLIPFAENIFKHGIVDDPATPARMKISVNNNVFKMECTNQSRPRQKDPTSGIGLNNVRRRLELLYPNTHNFTIEKSDNQFSCALQLDLAPLKPVNADNLLT